MTPTQTKYAIIGGSAAGMAAATAIRELDSHSDITVFSEEIDMPYFRPLIPFLISGKKKAEDMALVGEGPYQKTDIDIQLQSKVTACDLEKKILILKSGQKVFF